MIAVEGAGPKMAYAEGRGTEVDWESRDMGRENRGQQYGIG